MENVKCHMENETRLRLKVVSSALIGAIFPGARPAIRSRPLSVPFFKRFTERRLTFVTDEGGDLGGRQPAFLDHLNGLVHSPTRQISKWRFPHKFCEPVCECRA